MWITTQDGQRINSKFVYMMHIEGDRKFGYALKVHTAAGDFVVFESHKKDECKRELEKILERVDKNEQYN